MNEKKKTSRPEWWDRLDKLGEQWLTLPAEGNEAVRQKLNSEIFSVLYSTCGPDDYERTDAIGRFFEQDWHGDGFRRAREEREGLPLSAYFNVRIKNRLSDVGREGKHRKDGVYVADLSLEGTISGTEDLTLADTQADPVAEEKLNGVEEQERFYELISIMLNLPDRLRGRANNPTRQNYFRMFFTDGLTGFVQSTDTRPYLRHERDMFRAMKLEFLDFYMAQRCRTLPALRTGALRPYGQLVEGRGEEECRLPLPGDVYLSYLERNEGVKAGNAALSQQRKAYEAFFREQIFGR